MYLLCFIDEVSYLIKFILCYYLIMLYYLVFALLCVYQLQHKGSNIQSHNRERLDPLYSLLL